MDKYIVKGGRRLKGNVEISGSKNASLPILTASLLTDEPCIIHNVPKLKDVDILCSLLAHLGKKIERKDHTVRITSGRLRYAVAPYDLVKKMRASILVLGPMLARWKKARVSLPGGCAIGTRPIHLHINGFKEMGCDVKMNRGYVCFKTKGLKGKRIVLDFPSVGATENLLMGAVLARGRTIIENVAQEPEIVDLARCLKKMGAKIFGEGTSKMAVNGCQELKGVEYTVIPDRIETGTFMLAAAITKGNVTINKTNPNHLICLIEKLRETGVRVDCVDYSIQVHYTGSLDAVSVETAPYPGFPTDMQALWVSLMSCAQGVSIITESIFEKRFLHVPELNRMGSRARIQGNTIVVEGVTSLSGAPVMVSDLRAGASLVLAGLCAKNTTEISRIYHCDRGYENIEKKLRKLGARIRRMK